MAKDTRIIFWGSPEFAANILLRLIEEKFNIVAVVTQSDKKIGRKQEVLASPVKKIALKNKINIFQPENLKDEKFIGEVKQLKPDLAIVAAYGKIIPKNILDIPGSGSINVHASILPKYRGASPIQSAIMAGDEKTGVTLMLMDTGLDTGDIIIQKEIKIGKDETAESLTDRLSALGGKLLLGLINPWLAGKVKTVPQDNKLVSHSKIIKRQDGEIDWNETAEQIHLMYRAFYPWPGIHTLLKIKGVTKRLKLTEINPARVYMAEGEKVGEIKELEGKIAVQTGKGLIIIKKAQIEGKKEMGIREIISGYPEIIGSIFQKSSKL
jgi:methionyl-tRNA formyltransferase